MNLDYQSLHKALPFGQQVYSEVYQPSELYSTILQPQGFKQELVSLRQMVASIKKTLNDENISHEKRIHTSLKIIQGQAFPSLRVKNEQKLKEWQPQQNSQQCKEELTVQIQLSSEPSVEEEKDSQERIPLSISQENQTKTQKLKLCIYQKQNQLLLLKKEKRESQERLQKQIDRLTLKLSLVSNQADSPKLASKCQYKSQQMIRMNKWLQTLNKLLQGAQRQAAAAKEQLKKYQEANAKQMRQKQEEIKNLQQQIQALKPNSNASQRQIYSLMKQCILSKEKAQRQALKKSFIHYIQST